MRRWTQTRELTDLQGRIFLINWELGSHSSHPAVGYSYVFSLAGHTNAGRTRAALALKVNLLS